MAAGVAGVAFYGVDGVVFDFFDDTDVVGDAILTTFVGVIPIEKDDIARAGRVGVILPLFTGFEPILTNIADSEAGQDAVFEVAALIGTPTDEDGTPIYSLVKAVPSPIGFTADIADL